MGEWFTSFDDAWASFLAREEPLESFFDEFPDDPEFVTEGWVVVPPPAVKREALRVQPALELPELRIVPHHFLHAWLRSVHGGHGPDLEQLLQLTPFEVRVARVNCFHTAVVAEVEADALAGVSAPATFLPHLSLAYVDTPIDPQPVRDAVAPLRDTELGAFVVDELVRVRVPAARTTILQPCAVVERARLRR